MHYSHEECYCNSRKQYFCIYDDRPIHSVIMFDQNNDKKYPINNIDLVKPLDPLIIKAREVDKYQNELKEVIDNLIFQQYKIHDLPTLTEDQQFDLILEEAKLDYLHSEQKRLKKEILKYNLPNYKAILEEHEIHIEEIYVKYRKPFEDILKCTESEQNEFRQVLTDHNITTKKDWKEWLRKNHPDKNSDTDIDLCRKILEAGNAVF